MKVSLVEAIKPQKRINKNAYLHIYFQISILDSLQESIEDFLVKLKNKDPVSCLSSRVFRLLSEFF